MNAPITDNMSDSTHNERQKGYWIKHSYDSDFVNLMLQLEKKYPEEVFLIQGIASKSLDVVEFSKNFFNKSADQAVAEQSVDGNANVNDKSIHTYVCETPKAVWKLNSLFLLWKWVGKLHGKENADICLEKVINGELFVNDMTGYHAPYSYYMETPIFIRINGSESKHITLRQLFDQYSEFVNYEEDMESIDCSSLTKELIWGEQQKRSGRRTYSRQCDSNLELSLPVKEKHNIEVLDSNGKWVKLQRILRHKNHADMIAYQTKNGDYAFVTSDHPVIMENGSEKKAGNLVEGDKVNSEKTSIPLSESIIVNDDIAYIIGFITGDGNIPRHKFYQNSKNLLHTDTYVKVDDCHHTVTVYQKDVSSSKIYKVFNNILERNEIKLNTKDDSSFSAYMPKLKILLARYMGIEDARASFTKTLPINIWSWNKSAIEAYIAGLIDSDGTADNNGKVDIRLQSYSIIAGLYDLLTSLDIKSFKRIPIDGEPNQNNKSFIPKESLGFSYGIYFITSEGIKNKSEKLKDAIILEKDQRYSNKRDNSISKIIRIPFGKTKHLPDGTDILEYVYDITTSSGTFYANGMKQHNCFAFDLRKLITEGMSFFKGNFQIRAPKRSASFNDLVNQSTAYISNQIMGAAAYPNYFPILDWFYRKEYGQDYMKEYREGKMDSYRVKEIRNQFQNIIYSLNFPFRGSQSAFTNLSVLDKGFCQNLFADHVFVDPDTGDVDMAADHYDSIIELSKFFFEYYTDINGSEGMFTFPVMTIAISLDEKGEYIDPDFVKWAAEVNCKKALANIFQDKPTSFSSCCFAGQETIKIKNVETNEIEVLKLVDFIRRFCYNGPCSVTVNDGELTSLEKKIAGYKILSLNPLTGQEEETEITGILKKQNENGILIKVTMSDGAILEVTPDHIFLVKRIADDIELEIKAIELSKNPTAYLLPIE